MRRFAYITLLLFIPLGLAQQPQKTEPKFDVKRCTPTVVSQKRTQRPKTVQVRKGDKSTGYSPVIAFDILESGEVMNAHVKRSSGIADLDAYALSSIQGTKYKRRAGCGTLKAEADVSIDFY